MLNKSNIGTFGIVVSLSVFVLSLLLKNYTGMLVSFLLASISFYFMLIERKSRGIEFAQLAREREKLLQQKLMELKHLGVQQNDHILSPEEVFASVDKETEESVKPAEEVEDMALDAAEKAENPEEKR